jgi:hypothetical protein
MKVFDWVNFRVCIGEIRQIKAVFMDTETQNSVLGEVHVFVAKHLLFGVRVYCHKEGGNDVGQKHLRRHPRKRQFRHNDAIFGEFIVEGFEVFAQYGFVFVIFAVNGPHIIAGKGARENVDEVEEGFEGFVQKMCEVIFDLLRALNVDEGVRDVGQPIDLIGLHLFILLRPLDLQTHIAADSSHFGVRLQMVIHRKDGLFLGPESHVQHYDVIWVQFLAESVEEPIVRR